MQELFKHRVFICLLLNKQKGSKSEPIRKLIFFIRPQEQFHPFQINISMHNFYTMYFLQYWQGEFV